ncbi:MAG: hypothetical protein EBY39_02960 [Flavobacteriia bacterium]|nr:hypothetical protein [Flavobacteriia bacterium]
MGPVLNTIIGAAIKVGANLLNYWLEQKRQDQMILSARDSEMLKALIESQSKTALDPFVKVTRRILFLAITFTMCFLMIYYAMNPNITYDVILDKPSGGGILSWFWGSPSWHQVQLTGGLMLTSFMDLCFMVVGFYAIPSRAR